MKTQKMSPDQFSRWLAYRTLEIRNYNFDTIHDAGAIFNRYIKEHKPPVDYKIIEQTTMYIFFRENGSWLQYEGSSAYNFAYKYSNKVYKLTFCFNYNYYFSSQRVPFVEIIRIK